MGRSDRSINFIGAGAMNRRGFTIVELLIVIVIIAILAVVTIVAFNGVQQRAAVSKLSGLLTQGSKAITLYQTENGTYPTSLSQVNNGQGLPAGDATYNYVGGASSYCLDATTGTTTYSISQGAQASSGNCTSSNKALGMPVTGTFTTGSGATLTDGVTTCTAWAGGPTGLQSMTVDLGSVKTITQTRVWHYCSGTRTYNATKTEVSVDGSTWTAVFDSAVSGTYVETAGGKITSFSPVSARYVRDWTNGNSINSSNHWVEIQAY